MGQAFPFGTAYGQQVTGYWYPPAPTYPTAPAPSAPIQSAQFLQGMQGTVWTIENIRLIRKSYVSHFHSVSIQAYSH